MKRHVLEGGHIAFGLTAAHLEAPITHYACNVQAGRFYCKWLQEEDAMQHRSLGQCDSRGTRHLEIARTREDDTPVHDMPLND
jgi:hypothetical protein